MNDEIIDRIHNKEVVAIVRRKLEQVRPRDRAVWLARVLTDMTYKEIAANFGVSQTRVQQMYAKADLKICGCRQLMNYEQFRQELGYE